MFVALLRRGLFPDDGRLLDVGCGQGLLLSLLVAARHQYTAGRWPLNWPAPPRRLALHGIDSHAGRVQAARRALGEAAQVEQRDLRKHDFLRPCSVVVMIDVLLFLSDGERERVIWKAAAALEPGGLLLLREADAGAGLAFRLTQCSAWFDAATRSRFGERIYARSAAQWTAELARQGFAVATEPMSQGTPFANVLFVARKAAAPSV
ncbi:MAG TPA: class I SAM-dependent methyltransferase [Burkholderiales bacterium]|nr:class I SAM-dependent methyltransferase [Burkholderiales bacterium]